LEQYRDALARLRAAGMPFHPQDRSSAYERVIRDLAGVDADELKKLA
jgi:hypothetical protein